MPLSIDELVAHVERLIAEQVELATILETAVHELHQTSPRFDWTGIYELFPDNVLRLGPFVGAPTDHVFIGVGKGVCGTAVATGEDQNIGDVRAVGNYLACNLETRSELVVLIRRGGHILGQIDVDSDVEGRFAPGEQAAVKLVADALAVLL